MATLQNGRYKASIGYEIKDGERRPKVWELGKNEYGANAIEQALRQWWGKIKKPQPKGQAVWNWGDGLIVAHKLVGIVSTRATNELARAQGVLSTVAALEHPETVGVIPTTSPAAKQESTLYLHKALDIYVAVCAGQEDKSQSHADRARDVCNSIKRVSTEAIPSTDVDVALINRLWIEQLCQHFKNRPAKIKRTWRTITDENGDERKIEVRRDGKPISTYTVKATLTYLRSFFTWLSDNEEVTGFVEPKRMAKLFAYKVEPLKYVPITVSELVELYQAGSDWQRCLLLLGAMTGQTQRELTETLLTEFDFKSQTWNHTRHKTGVVGSHWLCPQLIKLLKARFAVQPASPTGNAFVAIAGKPLKTRTADAVRQSWDDLLDKVSMPRRVTFKMLRKFLAQWMKREGGLELAQLAVQHQGATVLEKHYDTTSEFEKLHAAQKKLHGEFVAAGMFDKRKGSK